MSIIFVMSNSQSPMPLHWVESMVQRKAWSDNSDCTGIFHIEITLTSPCTLKNVQVFLDPTVVGTCTQIWCLRSILLFNALLLSLFRYDGPHAVRNFGWDPTIINASRAFNHSIFLDLSSLCRLIIAVVLKPSLLLYFPSMTSLHCLKNILNILCTISSDLINVTL